MAPAALIAALIACALARATATALVAPTLAAAAIAASIAIATRSIFPCARWRSAFGTCIGPAGGASTASTARIETGHALLDPVFHLNVGQHALLDEELVALGVSGF